MQSLMGGARVSTIFTKMFGMFGKKEDVESDIDNDFNDEGREASSPADEALAEKFNKQIERALKDKNDLFKNYRKWRDAIKCGQEWRKEHEGEVNPFFIFSTLSALLPNVYAKNPEIEIAPEKQAGASSNYQLLRAMAETAEALLGKEFVGSTLKDVMKSNVMSALTTGVGWVKLSLQEEYGKDPVLLSRLRDAQDNLAALDSLRREVADDPNDDAKKAELRAQIESIELSLSGQGEVVLQKGLVIDRVPSEDILIIDPTLIDLSNYRRAKMIAQRVWMTKSDYGKTFGHDVPEGTSTFNNRLMIDEPTDAKSKYKQDESEQESLVQVWELWDADSQTVYTFAKGSKKWAREPYSPDWVGERWYPFFCLWFNEVDGSLDPISDVETQYELQEEYAALRTKIKKARDRQKTTMVARKGGEMEKSDYRRIEASEGLDLVFVGGNPNIPITQDIQQAPSPNINLSLFDPAMIMRDSEMALRSGDAARGYINKAKTATEAEIMNMGLQSFSAERQDSLEDLIREMANFALEIMLLTYTHDEVKQVVGAHAVWQQMPIDKAFKYLNLTVRAGSMSKPNKFKDREQWMQLLPVLQQGVQQIAQFRAQNQTSMADAAKRLLEETLLRFDERIDLDALIPEVDPQAMQMQQMQQGQPPQNAAQPAAMTA